MTVGSAERIRMVSPGQFRCRQRTGAIFRFDAMLAADRGVDPFRRQNRKGPAPGYGWPSGMIQEFNGIDADRILKARSMETP